MRNACLLASALTALLVAIAPAQDYKVGPGEEITKVSDIIDKLAPGDVVELTGDITDSFICKNSGTAAQPIIIRGPAGKRPKIDFAGARNGIETRGHYYTFENLELANSSYRGLFQVSHGIVLRNCCLHDNHNGVMGADSTETGDILIEFCEFHHNGNGIYGHQIYLASWKPGASSLVQFNYFHDSSGGANIKTRMPRNTIRYNWIENASNYECDLVDSDRGPSSLRPMHLLFLGNVVVTDQTGNSHHQFNLASDQPRSPGTSNTYLLVNNLFICNQPGEEIHMVRIGGDPSDVGLYNNIFIAPQLPRFGLISIEDVQAQEGPAGSPGRVKNLHGSHNFVSANGDKIPDQLKDTLRSDDPGFTDLSSQDYSLKAGSPCLGAGTSDAGIQPKYLPPMRKKISPGQEQARPVADKIDLGPFGATVKDANDNPSWLTR